MYQTQLMVMSGAMVAMAIAFVMIANGIIALVVAVRQIANEATNTRLATERANIARGLR